MPEQDFFASLNALLADYTQAAEILGRKMSVGNQKRLEKIHVLYENEMHFLKTTEVLLG